MPATYAETREEQERREGALRARARRERRDRELLRGMDALLYGAEEANLRGVPLPEWVRRGAVELAQEEPGMEELARVAEEGARQEVLDALLDAQEVVLGRRAKRFWGAEGREAPRTNREGDELEV